MLRLVLNKNDGGQRLDKFLSKSVKGLPPALMYKYIRKKRVKVNGKRAKENQILCSGDIIELYIPEEFTSAPKEGANLSAEFSRVRAVPKVVYEDDNIIVCDKAPGLLSHTGDNGENDASGICERDTLVFLIKAYLWKNGEYDPENEASFAPALCNRIDRNTGGLVIAAKNAESLREMNSLIRCGGVKKQYLCAVHGRPQPREGRLIGWIEKNSKTKTVTVYKHEHKGAKQAITYYKLLEFSEKTGLSLLEVTLGTGRTHQIRAQMAASGWPLVGEGKYASVSGSDKKLYGYSHQALYSYKITFSVPDGPLKYLDKKVIQADRASIGFLSLF